MSWLNVARKALVAAVDLAGKLEAARASDPTRSEEERARSASLSQQLEILESALRLGESSSERSETGNDHRPPQDRLTIDG